MHPHLSRLAIALTLAMPGAPRAQIPEATLDKLLEVNGAHAQFSQLTGVYKEAMAKAPESFADRSRYIAAYTKAAEEVFKPEKVAKVCKEELAKTLAPGDAETIIAFFSTELGAKARELEIRGLHPEQMRKFTAFSESQPLIPPGRLAHIDRSLADQALIDARVTVQLADLEKTFQQHNAHVPGPQRVKQWVEHRKQIKPALEKAAREGARQWAAFLYQELSDEELGRLADTYATPAHQNFSRAFRGTQAIVEKRWLDRGRALHEREE